MLDIVGDLKVSSCAVRCHALPQALRMTPPPKALHLIWSLWTNHRYVWQHLCLWPSTSWPVTNRVVAKRKQFCCCLPLSECSSPQPPGGSHECQVKSHAEQPSCVVVGLTRHTRLCQVAVMTRRSAAVCYPQLGRPPPPPRQPIMLQLCIRQHGECSASRCMPSSQSPQCSPLRPPPPLRYQSGRPIEHSSAT